MKPNESDQNIFDDILSKDIITGPKDLVKDVVSLNTTSEFERILQLIKNSHFDNQKVVYVDVDVHDVFKKIRDGGGPNMGQVFSFFGEQFIKRYTQDIQKLTAKNNKYL
ncbi:MAG: hypothetical protein AAGA43_15690 [Bacteroidota bacterium]